MTPLWVDPAVRFVRETVFGGYMPSSAVAFVTTINYIWSRRQWLAFRSICHL